jgi:integrase
MKDEQKFEYEGFFPPITHKNLSKHKCLQPASIQRIIAGVLKISKVDPTYTPGDLRAAVATKCYYEGVHPNNIIDRGGWASQETFYAWYRKIQDITTPLVNSELRVEQAVRRRPVPTNSGEYVTPHFPFFVKSW